MLRDGGVIRAGFDAELDELRLLSTNADQFLIDLEEREKAATGIPTLKVGYNRVHGYYIEISKGSPTRRRRITHGGKRSKAPNDTSPRNSSRSRTRCCLRASVR